MPCEGAAELGRTAVRVRDFTRGGYKEQVRGYVSEKPRVPIADKKPRARVKGRTVSPRETRICHSLTVVNGDKAIAIPTPDRVGD